MAGIMEEGRIWFRNAHAQGIDALEINRGRSSFIDRLIRLLLSLAENRFSSKHKLPEKRAAVFALGGYGREEMGFSSDIDLLFLYEGGTDAYIKEVVDSILYPLWDNKVDVTGATRTLADCVSISKADLRAQTAMLDARLVSGDGSEARRLISFIRNQFQNKKERRRFINAKLSEQETRLKRFGESIYLLEPNVKEGEGGLRDYHTLLWIAKAAYPHPDFVCDLQGDLLKGVNYLWRVRNALHLLSEKNDRLGVLQQDPIARSLGYQDSEFSIAAEQFMQAYYKHASTVHLQCQRAIEQIVEAALPEPAIVRFFTRKKLSKNTYRSGGKISYMAGQPDPAAILKLFALANRKNLSLDAKTKELIMQNIDSIDKNELFGEEANKLWRDIFSSPASLSQTLNDMHECGLLAACYPEMEPLIHRIQHDGFHFYTADEHSLHAVRELGALFTKEGRKSFPIPAEATKKIRRMHLLTFATLFHDIGKGRGGGHAEIGAELIKDITKRLGWPKEDQDDISFLIRSHLLVPTLAYRRDVKDPHLVERLAQTVETTEILAMLYLLAFADVRAMGPHIWSDWKGGLLAELYQNTLSFLEGQGESAKRQRALLKRLEKVHEIMGESISREDLGTFFTSMPERYLFQSKPERIAAHLKMTNRISNAVVLTQVNQLPGRGITELAIVTRDEPGLFAKIAGVLSLNGVNIIDAQLFTLPDGTVLDLLWVADLAQKPIRESGLWREIDKEMEEAIKGSLDVHKMVKRQTRKRLLSRNRKPADTQIEIDNDVSAGETVVDVVTMDRPGLLYDISRTFADLGCTIDRAKITTYADRVIDVFYIRDAKREKITSKERLKQIKEAVTNAIE